MAAIFDKAGKDLLAARISEEKAKPVTTWVWTLGGDTHRTLTYPEGDINISLRPDLSEIQDILYNWMRSDEVLREASEIHPDQDSLHGVYYTGPLYRISHEEMVRIAEEHKKDHEDAKAEKQCKADEKFANALKIAKETGKPVILREWTAACNDPEEDCDIDDVIEYVLPDGSKKIERFHTW